MESILQTMDEKKRDRIINAAIKEFSIYPYEKASTNNIVKNAKISKGLLFHYFGSKEALYDKLIRFVLNKLSEEITAGIDWDETDILLRIKQVVILKIKIGQSYPDMYTFLIKVLSEKAQQGIDYITSFYNEYGVDIGNLLNQFYTKNIDFSKFKDQENIEKNMNIIQWTFENYSKETSQKEIDYGKIKKDIDEYIKIFTNAFY